MNIRDFKGFTLIELMVVMTIIALLLTVALPRYFNSVDKSKETVLRQDLFMMRDALDKHYSDVGRYPDKLDDLVQKNYLREIPIDPMTDTNKSWRVEPPSDSSKGGVYNVKSGAAGKSKSGERYAEW